MKLFYLINKQWNWSNFKNYSKMVIAYIRVTIKKLWYILWLVIKIYSVILVTNNITNN